MRIAFLHLEYQTGKIEENRDLIVRAVKQAADLNADWVLTPECAVSGYFFNQLIGTDWIAEQPDAWIYEMMNLAKEKKVTLFLSTPEKYKNKFFNSALVIDSQGRLCGCHRKHRVIGKAESWAKAGEELQIIICDKIKVGLLICADSYHLDKLEKLKEMGANVIIVLAAWPNGVCGPGSCWEDSSLKVDLPVFVCNQTGNHVQLDFRSAESVVAFKGKRLLSCSLNNGAILLFDWDFQNNELISPDFIIMPFK